MEHHTDTARLFGEKCRTCVRNTVSSRLFGRLRGCLVVWRWVAFFGLSTLSHLSNLCGGEVE